MKIDEIKDIIIDDIEITKKAKIEFDHFINYCRKYKIKSMDMYAYWEYCINKHCEDLDG